VPGDAGEKKIDLCLGNRGQPAGRLPLSVRCNRTPLPQDVLANRETDPLLLITEKQQVRVEEIVRLAALSFLLQSNESTSISLE
jgi:hypothetical protein